MKNLRTYLLALFSTLVFALPVFGSDTIVADTARFKSLKRPFIMSLTIGKQFHTGGRPDALLLGDRKSVNTEMSLRMAGFFNRFVGAYGQIDVCGDPWKRDWQPVPGLDFQNYEIECGLGYAFSFTSAISVGTIFRYEVQRWQFFGRIGMGVRSLAYDDKYAYPAMDVDNPVLAGLEYYRAERCVGRFIMEGGLTFGYRTSKYISIIMDVNYRHRIGGADEVVLSKMCVADGNEWYSDTDPVLERRSYKTKAFGNELVVLIGAQLQCDLSGRKKAKKQAQKKPPLGHK